MDKSMTGDGAVVRLWEAAHGKLFAVEGGEKIYSTVAATEHNALAVRNAQQAAEIERLTRERDAARAARNAFEGDVEASEDRTADLLKALEGAIGVIRKNWLGGSWGHVNKADCREINSILKDK